MTDEETNSAVSTTGWQEKADLLVQFLVHAGLDGAGPWKSAQQVADEILATAPTRDGAVDRLVATHTRMVAASGFLTGLCGLITLPVTVPADLSAFYVLSTRMVGGIAYLNGYDIGTEEVRSVVLVSLIGASGTALLSEAGVQLGTKAAKAALKQVPGKVFQGINHQVGFRLVTKAGTTGVVNMSKLVPLAGGVAGAGINFAGIKAIAGHARSNFANVDDVSEGGTAPTIIQQAGPPDAESMPERPLERIRRLMPARRQDLDRG